MEEYNTDYRGQSSNTNILVVEKNNHKYNGWQLLYDLVCLKIEQEIEILKIKKYTIINYVIKKAYCSYNLYSYGYEKFGLMYMIYSCSLTVTQYDN